MWERERWGVEMRGERQQEKLRKEGESSKEDRDGE